MATISFIKEMRLTKKETEALFKILEDKSIPNYVVTTPPSTKPSREDLDKLFGKKKK